jgi:hypothetical protein
MLSVGFIWPILHSSTCLVGMGKRKVARGVVPVIASANTPFKTSGTPVFSLLMFCLIPFLGCLFSLGPGFQFCSSFSLHLHCVSVFSLFHCFPHRLKVFYLFLMAAFICSVIQGMFSVVVLLLLIGVHTSNAI